MPGLGVTQASNFTPYPSPEILRMVLPISGRGVYLRKVTSLRPYCGAFSWSLACRLRWYLGLMLPAHQGGTCTRQEVTPPLQPACCVRTSVHR